jgi:Ca-activated chloride channel family protein
VRRAILIAVLLALGCPRQPPAERAATPPAASPPAAKAVKVLVAYGSEKKAWLEEQIAAFNASKRRLASGAPVIAEGKAMGSGEAMQDILDGRLPATVYSPASAAYLALLNQSWLSRPAHTKPISPPGDSVVLSPVVIAMWRPMAEALGWPKKALGWSDIIKISKDKQGWGGKGRPEWGRFKLGHTHPEFSSSGLLAVLAEAYAGAGRTRALAAKHLESKQTRAFVTAVESAMVHYGKSTGFFSDKMQERGPAYLSAAVLYENLVIESYGQQSANPPLVAIYPREGTFWADHPYSILAAPWVSPAQREGAEALLAFLKARPAQERALALGFRPGDPAVATTAPIDGGHGVDAKQPQTLLEIPDAATLEKLLALWRTTKKTSDVTLVFDKSGSMRGQPLAEAKRGAQAFLDGLLPSDTVSLLFFDNNVYPPVGPRDIASGKLDLSERIRMVIAEGGTALYDAVLDAYEAMDARARNQPDRIHALVVMTDGKDEGSRATLEQIQSKLRSEEDAPVKVFTIAYGAQAQGAALTAIAEAGRGSHSGGSVGNIVQVYRDIASFF